MLILSKSEFLHPFFNTTSLYSKDHTAHYLNYPFVQLHGCLFVFAYLLCNSTAIIGAHFLRHYAPNVNIFNHRVWFAVHAIFNSMAVFLIALGAMFVIFEYQWMWPGWNIVYWSPAVWHIISGAISLVLVILQVVGSICHLSKNDHTTTSFDVYHPVAGLTAFIFAIISLVIVMHKFIGHDPTTKILVGGGVIGIVFIVEWITMKAFENKSIAEGETTALLISEQRSNRVNSGAWQSYLSLLVVVHALLMTALSIYFTFLIFQM